MRMFGLLALAILATTGCSRTENEPGPGGVTVSEAKALDAAADMLESRDTPPEGGPQDQTDADAEAGAD